MADDIRSQQMKNDINSMVQYIPKDAYAEAKKQKLRAKSQLAGILEDTNSPAAKSCQNNVQDKKSSFFDIARKQKNEDVPMTRKEMREVVEKAVMKLTKDFKKSPYGLRNIVNEIIYDSDVKGHMPAKG